MADKTSHQSKWKQTILTLLSLALSLILVGFIGWVIWKGFAALSSQVVATVIVGIITATASVFAVLKSKQAEHRRDIENDLRKQKAPIYEEFSSFLFKILMSAQTGKAITENEMLQFVMDFNRKLIVWGADNVIKEWSNFKRLNELGDYPPVMNLIAIEKILYAIRADMGHKNKDMRQGDLLAIFINDIHTYLREYTALQEQRTR
ncbi:MAG TPA: hypothetical protein VGC66_12425 [Pyrinomonadaceae bacterium]|jgi:hypothetical protein